MELTNRVPLVSFSFDDFPRTALTTGGKVLEKHGLRGTYYAAMGLMNSSNELGEHFSAADLQCLLQNGHELGSHTFSHVSCRSLSPSSYRAEVEKGRLALSKLIGCESGNFSYPFGDVTGETKKVVGPDLNSARSIFAGFNGPTVDLNLLRANRLYGDASQLAQAESLIAENARRRAWLIFYTHDVRTQPSAYGCTPELFEAVVVSALRSGSRVLTVTQVLSEFGNSKGQTSSH